MYNANLGIRKYSHTFANAKLHANFAHAGYENANSATKCRNHPWGKWHQIEENAILEENFHSTARCLIHKAQMSGLAFKSNNYYITE